MDTTMLVSLAEASNVFSVMTVLLVFCAMVVFIISLHGNENRSTSVVYTQQTSVRPIPMEKVVNPFSFVLCQQQSNINDVQCSVSSRASWMLQALWGVTIEDFHRTLAEPWPVIADDITAETYLADRCLQRAPLKFFEACENKEVHLAPPHSITSSELGSSPRSKYPLVVLLVALDIDSGTNRKVGAMVNVIHIRDNLCPMANGIVFQYLKMTDGSLSNLKQLFVARETSGPDEEPGIHHEESNANGVESDADNRGGIGDASDITCVVCQNAFATRALLPCRHVCSCANCFRRLDKCPMCRSLIHSYFCIREEDESAAGAEQDSYVFREEPAPTWRQRLMRWNERFNQF